ncbi:MAG TPA: CsiV family protein [Gammaproteobacteria bacterium]|nr:CsiV family protein [Gammaproteobacteria bacterium]
MKCIRIAVATIMGLATAGAAFAQQSNAKPEQHWFAVEVIVFRPTTNMAGGNEMWPADPKLPNLKNAVVPAAPEPATTQPAGMTTFAVPSTTTTPAVATVKPEGDLVLPLPVKQYQLQGVWNRLAQSGRYQPLVHTGWIEQGVPPRQAPKVSITPLVLPASTGLPVSTNLPVSTTLPTATTVFSDNTLAPAPVSSQQPAVAKVTTAPQEKTAPPTAPAFGTIKLTYDRFLHLALNIAYRPVNPTSLRTWQPKDGELAVPSPATTASASFAGFGPYFSPQPPKPQAIVMDESRRISPKTINYFDNPLFGVIVQVTPIEPPAAATVPAPTH